jgi:hypothetical protein
MAELERLKNNETLALGVQQNYIKQASKILCEFGSVLPQLVIKDDDNEGSYKVLNNPSLLEAAKSLCLNCLPTIIVNMPNNKNYKLLALLMSLYENKIGALAQGELINSIITTDFKSLGSLSKELGMSKSWLSKRRSLVQDLTKEVKDLVLGGSLSPRSAEEIAKLPRDAQLLFAERAIMDGFSKDKITKFVAMYNDPKTPENIKKLILTAPSDIPLEKLTKKRANRRKMKSATEELISSLNFALVGNQGVVDCFENLDLDKIAKLLDEKLVNNVLDLANKVKILMEAILPKTRKLRGRYPTLAEDEDDD